MNNDKENPIRFRLKVLSRIEPTEQAIASAMEKTKEALAKSQKQNDDNVVRTSRAFVCGKILKYAIAAVVLIGIGFIAGRLAIPAQPQINMDEIRAMMDKKCADNAEKILAASSTVMDKRMSEIVNVIEAARQKDRQWTAAAFEKIENDRRTDNNRFGNSIVALASRTSN